MSDDTIYLVVDTNLFFECKLLEDLPWSEIPSAKIVILLTKPLLDEVDKHKKMNGRTRDRALRVFKRIRAMKKAGLLEENVVSGPPNVLIRVATGLLPDKSLEGQLDYTKNDDRLLGIVSTLHNDTAYSRVSLLTHDIGPASNADGLSLPNILIDDHWLRTPQISKEAKQVALLERELSDFRKREPKIKIELLSPKMTGKNVVVKQYKAAPLSEAQIDSLIVRLKESRPMATEFSSSKGSVTDSMLKFVGTEISYEPPTEDEMEAYKNADYPKWVDDCRGVLLNIHSSLAIEQLPLQFHFEMENVGSRPASKVLVSFKADGDIYMRREIRRDEDEIDEDEDIAIEQCGPSFIKLPPQPLPPKGRRVVTRKNNIPSSSLSSIATAQKILGNNPALSDMMRFSEKYKGLFGVSDFPEIGSALGTIRHHPVDIPSIMPYRAPKRDPEAFYYKEWSDGLPVDSGALECDLWRHSAETEPFNFEVLFDKDGNGKGIILASVHAENLTKPSTRNIPVRLEVEAIDTFAEAEKLIITGRVKISRDELDENPSLPKIDS